MITGLPPCTRCWPNPPSIPVCRDTRSKNKSCATIHKTECYSKTTEDACCITCKSYEINIPGCRYGDRATDCANEHCQTYTPERQRQCCSTCAMKSTVSSTTRSSRLVTVTHVLTTDNLHDTNPDTTTRTSTVSRVISVVTADRFNGSESDSNTGTSGISTLSSVLTSGKLNITETDITNITSRILSKPSVFITERSNNSGLSRTEISYVSDWAIPVAGSVGAALFLTFIAAAVFICYWRRKRPSSVADKAYRIYNSNLPEPVRTAHNAVISNPDTAEYAYINPNEMDDMLIRNNHSSTPVPVLSDRNNPLPGVSTDHNVYKAEYLTPSYGYPGGVDRHGYLIPLSRRAKYTELQDNIDSGLHIDTCKKV